MANKQFLFPHVPHYRSTCQFILPSVISCRQSTIDSPTTHTASAPRLKQTPHKAVAVKRHHQHLYNSAMTDDDDQVSNVASMPDDGDDDDDYDKFKSALGKRNLEEFVVEQTRNKRIATDQLMPFLNVDNGTENAVPTEGILPLIDILELPGTRTCCRSREAASSMVSMPLLHIQQKDKWSCGYRNLQMLLSALIPLLPSDHLYHQCVPASLKRSDLGVAVPIPSLRDLQECLQQSWRLGLDPRGAAHYNGVIVGKVDEIGAVEVSSILAAVRIDSVVVQFIKTHESRRLLGPFVWSYFEKRAGCDCLEPRTSAAVAESLLEYALSLPKDEVENLTCRCPTVPLYLQWEGHSVSIVGIRKIDGDTDYQLIVLDPAKDGSAIQRHVGSAFELPSTLHAIDPLILEMKEILDKDCQLVMTTKRSLNDVDINHMKERVNAVTAARESVAKRMGFSVANEDEDSEGEEGDDDYDEEDYDEEDSERGDDDESDEE